MAYSPFDTFMVRDDKATTIMQLILSLVPPLVEPRNVDMDNTVSFMIFHDNGKRAFDLIAPIWMVRAIEQAMAREHFDDNRYVARVSAILTLSGLKIKLTKKHNKKAKKREWITQDQWYKLHAELPTHLKAPASFAVLTGLRQANVLGLQWKRVDLGRGMAFVEGMDSKSGASIGVPLSPEAVAILEAVKGQHAEWCFTFRGKPFKDIKTSFMAACVRAGLGQYVTDASGNDSYVGFTWHGLRHTWATWQAQNGTPLEVIKELGGWTDMRMMENYAHHVPGLKAKFVGNLGLKK
jgi:integrase